MTTAKFSLAALPLAASNQLLTHALTPDPNTPSAAEFHELLQKRPSLQRRARVLPGQAHFSYVSPLPLAFPYRIENIPEENQEAFIEAWLAKHEAVDEKSAPQPDGGLSLYYPNPETRDGPRHLIGLAETGLRDCSPNLDVGDAFTNLGVPALTANPDNEATPVLDFDSPARQELVDILAGHSVLRSNSFAPWSLRYSGHQFGSFAGQLGDGRAISILVTPHASDPESTWEFQLKGAGRTPFSRSADGLAVLRSSIREFLCSEAMHALSIPTTRSLALISLPSLSVERERTETACVLTRVAPSFIRIGSFEALNAPTHMSFFGGGQQKPDLEALRILGEWVSTRVLKLGCASDEPWGAKLVLETAKRNAKMVAAWQAYGFMHGVINTDNVSILGLTIDYGPYAFMDVWDPFHICNHTDSGGRYAYKFQPTMIIYALRALVDALAPLIGAECLENKAVTAGWAKDISDDQKKEWSEKGKAHILEEMERIAEETTAIEYGNLMRKRLGLRSPRTTDESRIFAPLLAIMGDQSLDFHRTFRTLCQFKPSLLSSKSENLDVFITSLIGEATCDHKAAATAWLDWLDVYATRIEDEQKKGAWSDTEDIDKARTAAARSANPRFILRQWLLEEVIAKVEKDQSSGKRILAKVLHMASNPFEPWGDEDGEQAEEGELENEVKEERRYCGMGEKRMLGFQCSCSS